MIRPLVFLLCATGVCMTTTAFAHSVWIEPKDDQLVIRFAEPGGELETSPGYLDSLTPPLAFIVVTNAPVAAEAPKKADHFLLVGVSLTNTACAESIFAVRGGRKPIFYARWQPANAVAARPLLTLDLVPSVKAGEVRVYFRGKPLGGIEATFRRPDRTEQKLNADAEGFLRFAANQSGLYLLTVAHYREPLAGFHGGRPYEQTSHNCSLTWQQP